MYCNVFVCFGFLLVSALKQLTHRAAGTTASLQLLLFFSLCLLRQEYKQLLHLSSSKFAAVTGALHSS
jgi:hypothetical protein